MLTVGGHGQRGCWRELADRVEGTERMGDVLKGQVGGDGARIDVPLYLRVLQQGADLRGEPEAGALPRPEERFFSDTVASEEEAVSALVPDDEGEHAAQALDHPCPMLLVQVHEDFGVDV